ncbi:hypothetical protein MY8738_008681 [Beauveria namnaoensis]
MKSIPIVLAGLAALAAARPPTMEELCVGFNGDIDTCQREAKVCFDEIHAKKEVFTWNKLFECTQARLPSPSSSAAPAAAAPTTTSKDKPAPPHSHPTKEEQCVGSSRDFDMWLREYNDCFDEIHAKEGFTMDKVVDCVDARVSSLCSSAASAAAAPTTTSKDKPAPPHSHPTKEELCVGFDGDFDTCQREASVCFDELGDKEDFTWEKLSKCVQGRLPCAPSSAAPLAAAPATTPKDKPAPPQDDIGVDTNRDGKPAPTGPPTREELCVGFNGDFDTCQREASACFDELGDKEDFTWEKFSKCVQGRLPAAAAAAPTTKPEDKPAPPPNKIIDNSTATTTKADIRVDTNRDGIVDVDGTSDQAGKDTWTDAAGAIFLPNIADSGDRCKKLHTDFQLPKQLATLYDTLAKCHDAADDEQRAPQNLAPMRTMPIAGLSDSATGTISVADERSRALVRVFRESKDGKWEIVKNDSVFTAQDLKDGLTLGVDARDTRRPDWDGRVKVDFSVRDGANESKDTVMLRVAPVLLQHHRQAVKEVFVSDFRNAKQKDRSRAERIVYEMQSSMQAAGITGPTTRLANSDPWAQDYFEPAYASMPGPNKTVVALRVVLEGSHDKKYNSTSIIYTRLRGDGVGAVAQQLPRQANLTRSSSDFDAGGNLESIPPYEFNGKKYPAGRIIVGGDSQHLPVGMDFFKAQEAQAPLVLDSTWLTVKHVDEIVQAVPAKTPRGWAILAIDAEMGLKMLRDAEAAGHGDQLVIGRGSVSPTITEFLNTSSNMVAAEVAAKAMAANMEILKKETGLSDAEIHRVPALISVYELSDMYIRWSLRRRDISSRDEAAEAAEAALDQALLETLPSHARDKRDEVVAETTTEKRRQAATPELPEYNSVLPSLVNGVPLSDSYYLAPKPFGVVIDGKDIFEEAATAAYKKAGFTTVQYLDEWFFHMSVGELHCMSNMFRDISEPWW